MLFVCAGFEPEVKHPCMLSQRDKEERAYYLNRLFFEKWAPVFRMSVVR